MKLISGPLIARISLRSRKWAHDAIRRGWLGDAIRHRGVLFVRLSSVEAFFGIQITPDQIEQAREGRPDRVLVLSEEHANGAFKAES